jgi:hypothetical protein
MKRFFNLLILALIFINNTLIAKQWTVSNNANIPGQFTDAQHAHDVATDGDTLLFTDTPSVYLMQCHKRLTIIGNANITSNASLSVTKCFKDVYSDASYSKFIGLNSRIMLYGGADDIIVERCVLDLRVDGNTFYPVPTSIRRNFLARNCIINNYRSDNVRASDIPGFTFSNCYITGSPEYYAFCGGMFINNIFFTKIDNNYGNFANSFFANNIFYGNTGHERTIESQFVNNFTYQSTQDILPFNTNTGSGNRPGIDPQFIRAGTVGTFDITNDYTLQATSQAKNAGTDGKDIGPTGGLYPMTMQKILQSPFPFISSLTISSFNVQNTDSLYVQLKAKKRD